MYTCMDPRCGEACEEASETDAMTEHVSVFTPVGHAGAPLPHDYFQDAEYGSSRGRSKTQNWLRGGWQRGCNNGAPDVMSRLPAELKTQITSKLSQYDLVNVARAWPAFREAATASLHEKVVVDAHYSYLKDDCERATYIKTRYNLKRFLQLVATECEPGAGAGVGPLVRSFEIVNLPDGISHAEARALVCGGLPAMTGLSKFYCDIDAPALPPEILKLMPNKHELQSLAVNVDLRHMCEDIGRFEQIRKLSVSPFCDSRKLTSFLSQILVPGVVENLSTLRMVRETASLFKKTASQCLLITGYMLNNGVARPDASEGQTQGLALLSQLDLDFWKFLDRITTQGARLASLTRLEIDDVNVVPEDSDRVARGLALERLEFLSLTNVREVRVVPAVDYEVHDFTSLALEHLRPSFLLGVAPQLRCLRKLKLDYREPIKDSSPEFLCLLKSSAHAALEELDVTIHWDETKLAMWPSWHALARRYVAAIAAHSTSLQKLSLVAYQDSKFYEQPKRIPADLLDLLGTCTLLRSLRVHGESLQLAGAASSLLPLIGQLHHLQDLDLVGKSAPQHMGLMVVHDGVLDRWYRVIHVAIALARANSALRLVRVDKCLFECRPDGTVIPRTTDSDAWFDARTRVQMSAGDF
ncbi:LAQU0S11e01904g1_1 [Lachancea quebecensis]|uniref:LAQU0S11e01904g1_1 n=1 Tax=Lachancea quebecensis TaxID=1654605 RepID=A0A0P1KUC6_9SACH|nr:LAQU0S11e01904g1_1 [Lachancea quebecensis]